MVATQGFVFSVVSMGALTPVGALYSHIYRKHKESGIIRQRGCTVVLQSHAEVTERCTETADAEPSPDINTEPEMQGMARYCYASMHVYIWETPVFSVHNISIAHFAAFFRWFS